MKKLEKLTEIIEKMSPRKLLLLCGSAALAVFLLLYVILSALFPDQNNGKVAAGNITVVEAARDIAPQTVLTDDMLKTVEVPANLVRLSVGIEDVDDLIGDLEQAFAAVAD